LLPAEIQLVVSLAMSWVQGASPLGVRRYPYYRY
jgi:hypothetical protein